MGGFPTVTDGAVQVDSNTGTSEDLQKEIGTEVAGTDAVGRRVASLPQGDGDDGAGGEGDEGAEADGKPVVEAKAGEKPAVGKGRKSIQARIDEITKEKYQTQRERDAARLEVEDLKRQIATRNGGGKAAEKGDEETARAADAGAGEKAGGVDLGAAKFPKYNEWLQQGNDGELEDWMEARDSWRDAKATKIQATETARRAHSERFTKTASVFHERMAPILEAEPDFYDRIDPRLIDTPALSALPPGTPGSFGNFLVEQVITSEHPKEMLEHLSDKTVVQRLLTLQPAQIMREISKFELSLGDGGARGKVAGPPAGARAADDGEGDDEEETPRGRSRAATDADTDTTTSRAHPPAKPVRGSSQEHASPGEEPGDDASDDEWFRWSKRQSRAAS